MDSLLIWVVAVVACSGFQAVGHSHLPVPTPLNSPITQAGCGTSKQCSEDPDGCDPSGDAPCFFISSQVSSNSATRFELSGSTSGYVGIEVPSDLPEGPSYIFICGNNNGSFFYQILTNNSTTAGVNAGLPVINSVQGSVHQNRVQCSFSTSSITSPRREPDVIIIIIIIRGASNGTHLSAPTPVFNTTFKEAAMNSTSTPPPAVNTSSSLTGRETPVLAILLSTLFLYLRS